MSSIFFFFFFLTQGKNETGINICIFTPRKQNWGAKIQGGPLCVCEQLQTSEKLVSLQVPKNLLVQSENVNRWHSREAGLKQTKDWGKKKAKKSEDRVCLVSSSRLSRCSDFHIIV